MATDESTPSVDSAEGDETPVPRTRSRRRVITPELSDDAADATEVEPAAEGDEDGDDAGDRPRRRRRRGGRGSRGAGGSGASSDDAAPAEMTGGSEAGVGTTA